MNITKNQTEKHLEKARDIKGALIYRQCEESKKFKHLKKEQVSELGEADLFFMGKGAVGFFDSMLPKANYEDPTKIFKRHYFKEGHQHIGHYAPSLANAGPDHSIEYHPHPRSHWTHHPNLNRLAEALK